MLRSAEWGCWDAAHCSALVLERAGQLVLLARPFQQTLAWTATHGTAEHSTPNRHTAQQSSKATHTTQTQPSAAPRCVSFCWSLVSLRYLSRSTPTCTPSSFILHRCSALTLHCLSSPSSLLSLSSLLPFSLRCPLTRSLVRFPGHAASTNQSRPIAAPFSQLTSAPVPSLRLSPTRLTLVTTTGALLDRSQP